MDEDQKILATIKASEINTRVQSVVCQMNGMIANNEACKSMGNAPLYGAMDFERLSCEHTLLVDELKALYTDLQKSPEPEPRKAPAPEPTPQPKNWTALDVAIERIGENKSLMMLAKGFSGVCLRPQDEQRCPPNTECYACRISFFEREAARRNGRIEK